MSGTLVKELKSFQMGDTIARLPSSLKKHPNTLDVTKHSIPVVFLYNKMNLLSFDKLQKDDSYKKALNEVVKFAPMEAEELASYGYLSGKWGSRIAMTDMSRSLVYKYTERLVLDCKCRYVKNNLRTKYGNIYSKITVEIPIDSPYLKYLRDIEVTLENWIAKIKKIADKSNTKLHREFPQKYCYIRNLTDSFTESKTGFCKVSFMVFSGVTVFKKGEIQKKTRGRKVEQQKAFNFLGCQGRNLRMAVNVSKINVVEGVAYLNPSLETIEVGEILVGETNKWLEKNISKRSVSTFLPRDLEDQRELDTIRKKLIIQNAKEVKLLSIPLSAQLKTDYVFRPRDDDEYNTSSGTDSDAESDSLFFEELLSGVPKDLSKLKYGRKGVFAYGKRARKEDKDGPFNQSTSKKSKKNAVTGSPKFVRSVGRKK